MNRVDVNEFAIVAARIARESQGPAGEAARDLLDIEFRVSTVDPERVQLHQLARVVFVWRYRLVEEVIQVKQHRGAFRRGVQQVAKITERVLANHLLVVIGFQGRTETVDQVDIEMIAPELDHDLEQLTLAEHLAILGRGNHLRGNVEDIVRESVQ